MEELNKPDPLADRKSNEGLPVEELRRQHEHFEDCNGILLLTEYLTKQFPVNEDYLKMLSDRCFQETEQELAEKKKHKDKETCLLAKRIAGKTKMVEDDFKDQYIDNFPSAKEIQRLNK